MEVSEAAASGIVQLQRHAKLVQVVMIGWLLSVIATTGIEIAELSGFDLESDGSAVAASLYIVIGLCALVASLMLIVVFAIWIYRAAANVHEAEVAGFEYTPGWSVGWYFIPFANLVKPFHAMRQIWNASHGNHFDLDIGATVLTTWWAFWLSSNIANNISSRISFNAVTQEGVWWGAATGIVGSILSVCLFFAARALINAITVGQTQGYHLLRPEADEVMTETMAEGT
jgi:hypothetical protein